MVLVRAEALPPGTHSSRRVTSTSTWWTMLCDPEGNTI